MSEDMTWKDEEMRRRAIQTKDLITFYKSVIRPQLEYVCPAWHTSLPQLTRTHPEESVISYIPKHIVC